MNNSPARLSDFSRLAILDDNLFPKCFGRRRVIKRLCFYSSCITENVSRLSSSRVNRTLFKLGRKLLKHLGQFSSSVKFLRHLYSPSAAPSYLKHPTGAVFHENTRPALLWVLYRYPRPVYYCRGGTRAPCS